MEKDLHAAISSGSVESVLQLLQHARPPVQWPFKTALNFFIQANVDMSPYQAVVEAMQTEFSAEFAFDFTIKALIEGEKDELASSLLSLAL